METTQNGMLDILIVGSGPTGLVLAHELTRSRVQYRIIDRSLTPTQQTKALGIMAKTLELFEKMGVAQTAIDQGLKLPAFIPYSEEKPLVRLDFEHRLDSPYPYVLMLPQNRVEQILLDQISKRGGVVERGIELVALTQHEDYVEAQLRHADGQTEHVQAKWLIGCDGAQSTVRHMLGLPFVGSTFEQIFAAADVKIDWNLTYNEGYAFLQRGNFIAYFPMQNGRHRVVIAYEPKKAPEGEVTLEEIRHQIALCGPQGAQISDLSSPGRFHVNQRKAERYLDGRVILAGDAAHIHSPVGAQGMNTGIQDAFNLAWKLALTVKGRAGRKLVESYAIEREHVGKELIEGTERFTHLVLQSSSIITTLRDHIVPLVLSSIPNIYQRLINTLAEISIAYDFSPIVHEQKTSNRHQHQLHAGERALDGPVQQAQSGTTQLFEHLHGTQHVLLAFSSNQQPEETSQRWQEITTFLSNSYSDVVESYLVSKQAGENQRTLTDLEGKLHERYGFENESGLVLLRPDGYIGFLSHTMELEPLQVYLQGIFLPGSPTR